MNFFKSIFTFFIAHKALTIIAALIAAGTITLTAVIATRESDKKNSDFTETVPQTQTQTDFQEPEEMENSKEEELHVISETTVSSSSPAVSSKQIETKPPQKISETTVSQPTKVNSGEYRYNTNLDIENNVFLDALVYTGYNLEKHRSDGNMWIYILASQKRGLGYLSKISYGGGSSGYETAGGKPDLSAFQKGGLVCASYATYVYFNYLPNIAGIDTSSLARPTRSTCADDWYQAAKQWVKKGYSKTIPFSASLVNGNRTKFVPESEIPIGSILIFCDFYHRSDYGSHVVVYAGYKNGYHWVFHVGNHNGPEFCAVERMTCGPDPQWPIAVITTPSNIRMSAQLSVSVVEENGNAISGVSCSLIDASSGKTVSLGKTDSNGLVIQDALSYGDYTVTITVPEGYTANTVSRTIQLTTANNSANSLSFTLQKSIQKQQFSEIKESSNISDSAQTGTENSD